MIWLLPVMVAGALLLTVAHRLRSPMPWVSGPWFALWQATMVFSVFMIAALPRGPVPLAAGMVISAAAGYRYGRAAAEVKQCQRKSTSPRS